MKSSREVQAFALLVLLTPVNAILSQGQGATRERASVAELMSYAGLSPHDPERTQPNRISADDANTANAQVAPEATDDSKPVADAVRRRLRDESRNARLGNGIPLLSIATVQAELLDREGALEALKKAREIAQSQIRPEARANSLIQMIPYAAKLLGRDDTLAICVEAIEAADVVKDLEDRVSLFTHVATYQIEAGRKAAGEATFARAVEAMRAIERPRSRETACRDLIDGLARSGDLEAAVNLIAKQESVHLSAEKVVNEIVQLKDGARADHLLTRLLDISRTTKSPGGRANSRRLIAEAMAARGNFNGALRIAREIAAGVAPEQVSYVLGTFQTAALAGIAQAMGKAGRRSEAKDVLFEAERIVLSQHPSEQNSSQLHQMVVAELELGDLIAAAKLTNVFPDDDANSKALATAALAIAQARARRPVARQSVERAIAFAEQVGPLPPVVNYADGKRAGAFAIVSKAQYAIGDAEQAIKTASEKINRPLERDRALLDLVELMLKDGKINSAQQTALLTQDDYHRGSALAHIAQAQAEAGQAKNVLAWIDALEPSKSKLHALLGLARGIVLRQDRATKKSAKSKDQ